MTSEATRTTAPTRPAIETPDGRFEFAAHNCFACGTLNAGGLGLVLHVEPAGRGPSSRSIAGSRAGRASSTAGSCARSSTRSWPGPWSARTTGASRRGWRSTSAAGRGRHADPGRGLDHPRPAPDRRDRRPRSSMPRPASSWRPRPATTSRPTPARKRELQRALRVPPGRAGTDDAPATDPPRPVDAPDDDRDAPTAPDRPRARSPPAPSRSWPPTAMPAEALGAALADYSNDPDGFADRPRRRASRRSPTRSTSPASSGSRPASAPSTASAGRCWPPSSAASGTPRSGDRPTPLLFIADRLFHERELEARWFAFGLLERTLATETERTWQLLRRAAREAGDWITVDSLAHPYGKGIAAEPYRWAELEQLVYSPSRWERRLVGSTIATMTHVDRTTRPRPGRRRPRPAAPRPADGRRRARRPEGAVVGVPLAGRRRPARRPRRPSEPRPSAPPRPTTATAPGSSATRSPSSTRPRPTSSATDSPGSASARAHRPPRPPPRSPPASAACPIPPPSRAPALMPIPTQPAHADATGETST